MGCKAIMRYIVSIRSVSIIPTYMQRINNGTIGQTDFSLMLIKNIQIYILKG